MVRTHTTHTHTTHTESLQPPPPTVHSDPAVSVRTRTLCSY